MQRSDKIPCMILALSINNLILKSGKCNNPNQPYPYHLQPLFETSIHARLNQVLKNVGINSSINLVRRPLSLSLGFCGCFQMVNARHHSVGCAQLSNCGRRRKYAVLLCFYEGG